MTVQQQVPADHPLMRAWTAYTATDSYANTKRWATSPAHAEGSLWAAFVEGWNRSPNTRPVAGEGETRAMEIFTAWKNEQGLSCDADPTGGHQPMKDPAGSVLFCSGCGETLTKRQVELASRAKNELQRPLYAAPPPPAEEETKPVAWRWRWTAEAAGQKRPGRWNYTENGECGDERLKDIEPLYARPPAEAWKPIESAPRDGSPILAFNPMVGVYSTAFTTRWTGEPNESGYEGFPCGFWPTGLGAYPFGRWDCQPTHWMPLPALPTPAKGGEA